MNESSYVCSFFLTGLQSNKNRIFYIIVPWIFQTQLKLFFVLFFRVCSFHSESKSVASNWYLKTQFSNRRILNLLTLQETVRSSFKDLLLLVYGMVDGHKSFHKFRVHIDIVFNTMKFCEINWTSHVIFVSTRSLFLTEFLFRDVTYVREFMQYIYELMIFEFSLFNII